MCHPTLGKTHLYCLPSPPPVGPTNEFEVGSEAEVQPNFCSPKITRISVEYMEGHTILST